MVDSTTVHIKPNFIENLDYAEAYYELPAGKVNINWKRTKNGIQLNVDCAESIHYQVVLPDNYREENGFIVKI